jgi:hypothetical protein
VSREKPRKPVKKNTANIHMKEDEQVARPTVLYAEGATVYITGSGAAFLLPVPGRRVNDNRRRRQAVTRQPTVNKPSHRIRRAAEVADVAVDSSASIRSTTPSKSIQNNPTSPTRMATYFHYVHSTHNSHGQQSTFEVTSSLL